MTSAPSNRSIRTEQLDSGSQPAGTCRVCSAPQTGDERFCESCGADHAATQSWSLEVGTDRSYFDRLALDGLAFPESRPVTILKFDSDQATIGRSSASRASDPDIDLSGALSDPAVSHVHAIVVRTSEGRFTVTDLDSTNGTTVNDEPIPIAPIDPFPLADGDRIHVGAWTTIQLRC